MFIGSLSLLLSTSLNSATPCSRPSRSLPTGERGKFVLLYCPYTARTPANRPIHIDVRPKPRREAHPTSALMMPPLVRAPGPKHDRTANGRKERRIWACAREAHAGGRVWSVCTCYVQGSCQIASIIRASQAVLHQSAARNSQFQGSKSWPEKAGSSSEGPGRREQQVRGLP